MATWTRTETDDYVRYTRDDGQCAYTIYKHGSHFHAEQFMPFAELEGADPPITSWQEWEARWRWATRGGGDTVA
jgi:hypothetical protein